MCKLDRGNVFNAAVRGVETNLFFSLKVVFALSRRFDFSLSLNFLFAPINKLRSLPPFCSSIMYNVCRYQYRSRFTSRFLSAVCRSFQKRKYYFLKTFCTYSFGEERQGLFSCHFHSQSSTKIFASSCRVAQKCVRVAVYCLFVSGTCRTGVVATYKERSQKRNVIGETDLHRNVCNDLGQFS